MNADASFAAQIDVEQVNFSVVAHNLTLRVHDQMCIVAFARTLHNLRAQERISVQARTTNLQTYVAPQVLVAFGVYVLVFIRSCLLEASETQPALVVERNLAVPNEGWPGERLAPRVRHRWMVHVGEVFWQADKGGAAVDALLDVALVLLVVGLDVGSRAALDYTDE